VHGEGSRAETLAPKEARIGRIRENWLRTPLGHCIGAMLRDRRNIADERRGSRETTGAIGSREKESKVNARKLTPSGVGYCWQVYFRHAEEKGDAQGDPLHDPVGINRMPPRACATVCPEGTTWTG